MTSEARRLPLLGIIGGVASGKTFVAEQLEQKGAVVINADRLAHEVLKYDEVKRQARERWGAGIFGPDGEIDRPALGKIVFAPAPDGPRELAYLEQLTHPRVRRLIEQRVGEIARQGEATAIVLDVPLLLEAGWHELCDRVLFVDAPRQVRQARAASRGWPPQEFARREAAQQSLDDKKRAADLVIDNAGSAQAVRAQIDQFWDSLIGQSLPK